MESTDQKWEYCKIELRFIHDGRNHSASAAPQNYWFQFVATSHNDDANKIIERAERFPISSTVAVVKDSKPIQSQHQNFLNMLISKLEQDGWESLGQNGSDWWEYHFKRPEQPKQSLVDKVKSFLGND